VETQRALLGAFGAVRRGEWPFASLMFAYVFLVIATFWILKPLKKGLFIGHYDRTGLDAFGRHLAAAEVELLAKVLNMVVAVVAVAVFTWLARRFRRERLTVVLMAFFLVADVAFAAWLRAPDAPAVWAFYLFGDLFSTLMVATFFAFLNDSVSPDGAKRLYGFVGFGAVLGGVVGSSMIGAFVKALAPASWMLVCAGIGLVIVVVALAAGRRVPVPDGSVVPPESAAVERRPTPVLEGAGLVLRSPYLLAIAAMVALYEIVSTVMDFQFTSAVSHFLDDDAIGKHLSFVFAVTNVASMLVQLFVTSTVMQRFGVGVALLILPFATGTASLAYLAIPTLAVGSLLSTADNAFNYSVNQSAKEALYVPTSPDEKYKAKAFIDMFVQRAAKVLGVGLSLAMGFWFADFASARWLAVPALAAIAVWVVAARYAGRRFPDQAGNEG
jgi:ATP:ADP antiporter, AAA family